MVTCLNQSILHNCQQVQSVGVGGVKMGSEKSGTWLRQDITAAQPKMACGKVENFCCQAG